MPTAEDECGYRLTPIAGIPRRQRTKNMKRGSKHLKLKPNTKKYKYNNAEKLLNMNNRVPIFRWQNANSAY